MPSLGGLDAWIEIEGTKADEFDIRTDRKEEVVTCWIASEVGKVRSKVLVHPSTASQKPTLRTSRLVYILKTRSTVHTISMVKLKWTALPVVA